MSTAITRLEGGRAGLRTEYDPREPNRDISRIDLKSYLRRIGYTGPLRPSVETLRGLHRAHILSIPFENLDLLLGREIGLSLDDLQDKLVHRHRGGYCLEHAILFGTVLERLGFRVTRLAARGPMDGGQRSPVTHPHGHAVLDVEVDGASWLADVGIGHLGPLEPLPMIDGAEAAHGGWTFRLDWIWAGDAYAGWMLRQLRPNGWFDLYSFSECPFFQADYEDMNFVMSHHPKSHFIDKMVVSRGGDTVRHSLIGSKLTTHRPNEPPQKRIVRAEAVPRTLKAEFGLVLEDDELSRLLAFVRRKEAPRA